MTESKLVNLAPAANPVSIRGFGTLTVDRNGNVFIEDQSLERMISERLGLEVDSIWRNGTTLANVRIDITPITAADVGIRVNGEVYPPPESGEPPAPSSANDPGSDKEGTF